jgi:hypothetical protein
MGQEKNTALGSIGSVLWGFDMLLEVLEKTREKYGIEKSTDDDPNQKLNHLATCVDHAHELLSKYYELTDKTEAYIVAMTLDPRQKHYYFYTHWDKVHHNGVKKKTQALYKEFRVEGAGASLSTDSQSSVKKSRMNWNDILKTPKEILPTDEANSAFDVLAWWRANELMYPTLARMAFELFSIPSMSAEVERVFSR